VKREIIITADGSNSLLIPQWQETFHSKHGAITEALHVFIQEGLQYWLQQNTQRPLHLLEIGFGTGLNALLTLLQAQEKNLSITYETLEAYPLSFEEINALNYSEVLQIDKQLFERLHRSPWEEPVEIIPQFRIKKRKEWFENINAQSNFDLIYFDAFGARVQPELWTYPIFKKMYDALKPQGVLVTYASKGSARRAMLEAGFTVSKIPGPPGKREMLRAQVL
jgi:tRNA U34 5-methylaminomethyl-2-thiouridine-forming methyltransferase MnmC